MRPSKIKAKLACNEPVLICCLHLVDPSLYELAGLLGWDGIWMDLEHHATGLETAATLIRAARAGGTEVMARPGKGEFMRLSRLLEVGAQGIMYPRCDDAAEARQVVAWAKFAPLGCRGFDGSNPDAPYCLTGMAEYVARANAETFVVVQIESPQAVEQAADIAAVPGVDVLFVGPADLSLLAGVPGQFDHPRLQEAIAQVAAAARQAGKHWGMPAASREQARQLLEQGARFICHGCDLLMVKEGMQRIQQEFRPLGFRFGGG
ncbi:MAG: aldolase [Pirellulales bacterium]|nr:aldolase [Pirellulales bacterium]